MLISTGALVTREEERIGNTIPMPTFASRPSTMRSFSPVDIPQSSMVGTAKTADIGTTILLIPYSTFISVLEDKIRKPGDYLF